MTMLMSFQIDLLLLFLFFPLFLLLFFILLLLLSLKRDLFGVHPGAAHGMLNAAVRANANLCFVADKTKKNKWTPVRVSFPCPLLLHLGVLAGDRVELEHGAAVALDRQRSPVHLRLGIRVRTITVKAIATRIARKRRDGKGNSNEEESMRNVVVVVAVFEICAISLSFFPLPDTGSGVGQRSKKKAFLTSRLKLSQELHTYPVAFASVTTLRYCCTPRCLRCTRCSQRIGLPSEGSSCSTCQNVTLDVGGS